jgi:hypothetical protein
LTCTCPPPRKVSDWYGRVGHVIDREPLCEIHGDSNLIQKFRDAVREASK